MPAQNHSCVHLQPPFSSQFGSFDYSMPFIPYFEPSKLHARNNTPQYAAQSDRLDDKYPVCSRKIAFRIENGTLMGLLWIVLVLSFFVQVSPYPTNYLLSQNAHIIKEVIPLANCISGALIPPFNCGLREITGFKSTKQQKLKPLMCISKLKEYNFEEVDFVVSFSIRLKITDDGSADSNTKYTVQIVSMHQRQALTDLDLEVIFFSKETELLLNRETPVFYSFQYTSDKLHQNQNIAYSETIDLPILLGDPSFSLPSSFNSYQIVWYLTGLDVECDTRQTLHGINTQVSSSNQRQLIVRVSFKNDHSLSTYGRWIRLIELSIFLYHPSQLQKTQYFFEHKISQPQVVDNFIFTPQTYTHNSLALNGEFMFGMEGLIAKDNIKKLNYQLSAALTSDKLQVNISINLQPSIPVKIIETHFLFWAWVQCSSGQLYERDLTGTQICIQATSVKANFYIYEQKYSLECVTECAIQQGSSSPTCLGEDFKPYQCTPSSACSSNETKVPINANPCRSCSTLFGINCLECTYQECTKCVEPNIFKLDNCEISPPPQPCDLNQERNIVTGNCQDIVELALLKWEKDEFSNKVIVDFKLSSVLWKAINSNVQLALSGSSPDKISAVSTFYSEQTPIYSVQIVYNDSWIQGLELTASLNIDPFTFETLKFTSPQTRSVQIQMSHMTKAYFLINHDPQVFQIAQFMTILYQIASFIGFGFLLVGYIGGKYIALQMLSILQIAFLGLLQLDKFTPFQLASNRLSAIAGNFVFEPSPVAQMSQLNTLRLEGDFLGNLNIQIGLFTIFLVVGGSLLIYSKVQKTQKTVLATLIGMILVSEYSLYGLLTFSYIGFTSIGLQIKYQFIDKIVEPNYLSLVLGICYILVFIGYMVFFAKKRRYFGEFVKEMEMFSINEYFVCFLTAQKILIGFLLGLLCSFKYIGFMLAAFEVIFLSYAAIKQPFYYGFHTTRLICDHGWIILVLVGYNLQKLYFGDYTQIDSNPWLYAWPLTIIAGIYIIFIKNAVAMAKQIRVCIFRIKTIKKIYEEFTKYCEENGNAVQADIEQAKNVFLQKNLPEKVTLTDKQITLWKKMEKVQKFENQFTTNHQNESLNQEQQLIQESFKGKKELNRLKNNIRRKLKEKDNSNLRGNANLDDSDYSSLESKLDQNGKPIDQEFQSLLSSKKKREKEKMMTHEQWNQIDEQVNRFKNQDQVKETPEQLREKYEGLQFVHGDNTMVKLPKSKTIPIKNMKILQLNPILSYYRNQVEFELHAKINPFEELKYELNQQKNKLEELTFAQQKKRLQEEERLRKLKEQRQKPAKKLMYRGGSKYGKLEKELYEKRNKN